MTGYTLIRIRSITWGILTGDINISTLADNMAPIPSEEEWLAVTAKAREEAEEIDKHMSQNGPPEHPMPQLQAPFEESIVDSNDPAKELYVVNIDAMSRRREILLSKQYERLCGRKWRQKPRER